MSNPVLLYLPLREHLDGQTPGGTVSATSSGPVRYVNGGYLPEEGTTNLVPNPVFGTNATGWTGATRDTSYAYLGPASGLISATGADAEATYSLTVPASTHTLSAVVKNNAAVSRSFQLRYNGANVGSAVVVAAGAETRLSGQITGTAGAAAAGVRVTDSANGETFSLGHMQIEAKAYATTPSPRMSGDGTISSGYTWSGTPHASTSTRAASYLTLAGNAGLLASDVGSIAVRINAPDNNTTAVVLNAGTFGTNDWLQLNASFSAANNPPRILAKTGAGTTDTITGTGSIGGNTDTMLYAQWDATTLGVAVGTGALTSGARSTTPADVITGSIVLGSTGSIQYLNGPMWDVLICDRALTGSERSWLARVNNWSLDVFSRITPNGLFLPL